MAHEGNKHWLRKWLRFQPHQVIGDGDTPYLRRWYIIPRNPFANLYLHHFLCSDDDRALHDHPWWFASLVLKGGYWEHRDKLTVRSWRSAGSIAFRRPTTPHRVALESDAVDVTSDVLYWPMDDPRRKRHFNLELSGDGRARLWMATEKPAWTVVLTGPRVRSWGFLCPQGWTHWKRFVHQNGCGEA